MATDLANAGGVAIQASSGGVWAIAGSTATLLFAAFLKFLTDSNGRAMAAQAAAHANAQAAQEAAHAGEKGTLLAMYGSLEKRYGEHETKLNDLIQKYANLQARFEQATSTNVELQNECKRRRREVKTLADEMTLAKIRIKTLESESDFLRGEVNGLDVEAGRTGRYPVAAPSGQDL